VKLILAVIQPFRLDEVVLSCGDIPGFPGMTVVRARGFGREKFAEPAASPQEEVTDFKDRVQVEIVAPDELADEIVRVLARAAHTGRAGDGKVMVWPVERVVDIRTA
jgi:nitrogen regulatory protein PII